jgi:hypothetical protein
MIDKAPMTNLRQYENRKLTQAEVLEAFAVEAKQIVPPPYR